MCKDEDRREAYLIGKLMGLGAGRGLEKMRRQVDHPNTSLRLGVAVLALLSGQPLAFAKPTEDPAGTTSAIAPTADSPSMSPTTPSPNDQRSASGEPAWDDLSERLAPNDALVPRGWAPAHAYAGPSLETLPPLNAALKAALDQERKGAGSTEERKERDAIAFFYAARNFSPLWSRDGRPVDAAAGILAQLAHADDDALALAPTPTQLDTTGSLQAVAASDVALTRAVVAYSRQATGSRIDPQSISHLIGLKPELADPAETLELLVEAGAASAAKLAELNPSDPRYSALRLKLAELRGKKGGATSFPSGPTLRIGMQDRRVALLRTKLGLATDVGGDEALSYDDAVADAVAAFQHEHDLPSTGILNRKTITALFGAPSLTGDAEAIVRANMEIWRWLPHRLAPNRVEVNVPGFEVTVYQNGAAIAQHRVVVGKTDTPTPLFSNAIKYLIVNPYWNVPQSIIHNEMLPKGGGDLSYLEDEGYSVAYRGGRWVVKQLPGEKNALGRIKFLFPNDFSVYLHDTPSKALFSAKVRAFSHGCVRVDKPFDFAQSILNDTPDTVAAAHRWSSAKLEDLIGEKEHYVNLPAPLPIHISYFTASVDPATHALRVSDDVYGYVHAVAADLGLRTNAPPVVASRPRITVADRSRRVPRRERQADPSPAPIDDFDPR